MDNIKGVKDRDEIKTCGWFYYNIGHYFHKLNRAWRYFKFGFNDYDFDFQYSFLTYIIMKIKAYKEVIESDWCVAVHEDEEKIAVNRILYLSNKLREDDYWDGKFPPKEAYNMEVQDRRELFDLLNKYLRVMWD